MSQMPVIEYLDVLAALPLVAEGLRRNRAHAAQRRAEGITLHGGNVDWPIKNVKCATCGNHGALRVCGHCYVEIYCCRACQKHGYRRHKVLCRAATVT